jgi:hypothetical protein
MGYRLNTGVDTGGLPMYLLHNFIKNLPISTFIETGTASGDSIKEAAKYFSTCHTIELNSERVVKDNSLTNVFWHNGNSIDILPAIVAELVAHKLTLPSNAYRYTVFFLDAHWDGDKPKDAGTKDCYLLEELEIISKYSQDSIIIIDDARLFMGYPPHPNNPKEWPTIQQIFALINQSYPYHFTTIVDDFILSIPDRIEWIYQEIWMKNYKIRYPDAKR